MHTFDIHIAAFRTAKDRSEMEEEEVGTSGAACTWSGLLQFLSYAYTYMLYFSLLLSPATYPPRLDSLITENRDRQARHTVLWRRPWDPWRVYGRKTGRKGGGMSFYYHYFFIAFLAA